MRPQALQSFVRLVRELYGDDPIHLHRPIFDERERQHLIDCIDSNFVSSVGPKVGDFERQVAAFTGAGFAVATVNGTAALHVALHLAGVRQEEEVITQALTFVATANAISYLNARPVFVDVDRDTMGLSPSSLSKFLAANARKRNGSAWNERTGRRIAACMPMHTFGLPCRILEINDICSEWGIPVVEDAAESLGSYANCKHTGTFGRLGAISFNGNKIITTGGGGMIIVDNELLAKRAKHITTTAKIPHQYEFVHDEIGFNYRMPNLNAALGCAQMEKLDRILKVKSQIRTRYEEFFFKEGVQMAAALEGSVTNNWLNTILLADKNARDTFLAYTNEHGVLTRPIWRLITQLPMYKKCQSDGLENSAWLEARVVNIPSSAPTLSFGLNNA